jgi:hypothetical protein
VIGEHLGVVVRQVLTAPVGVMNELDISTGTAPGERHAQRVEQEAGAHVGGKLPAHEPAAEDVDHETQGDDALPAAQVAEVRDPELVGSGCLEAPLDEIRQPARQIGRGRLPARGAALGSPDPGAAHEARDAVTPDLMPRTV